jgi:Tfp pilus assembly protein PilF
MANKNRLLVWAVPLLVMLSALIYLPTLKYDFVWDDTSLIKENPDLDVRNPLALFSRSFAVVQASGEYQRNQYYRPLVSLTLWADKRLHGLNPHGYHLTNLILNALACLLAALLLGDMTRLQARAPRVLPVLLGGLAFSLHPAHVESVAFIAGRTDILMAVFLIPACRFLWRFRSRPGWATLLLTLVCFVLALLSKEAAIVFPVLALLVLIGDRVGDTRTKLGAVPAENPGLSQALRGLSGNSPPLSRQRTRRSVLLLLLVLVAVGYLFLRSAVLKGYAPSWEQTGIGMRLMLSLNALGRYTLVSLLPFLHKLVYPGPEAFARFGWPSVVGLAANLVLGWLVVIYFRRKSGDSPGLLKPKAGTVSLVFGAVWFFLLILPVCNWFPPGVSYLAERLVYLPVLGLIFALTGAALTATGSSRRVGYFLVPVAALYVLLLGVDTMKRLPTWRNNLTLYQTMVKETPESPHAHDNLGVYYRETGRIPEAVKEHRQAVALDPNHAPAHNNLGTALFESNDLKGAMTEYRTAVRLAPDFALAHNNLGVALQQSGNDAEAEREYRTAVRLQPTLALALNNVGEMLMARGQLDSALAEFRQAIRYQPGYALPYYNLGRVYEAQRRVNDARTAYQQALTIMPDFTPARQSLQQLNSPPSGR